MPGWKWKLKHWGYVTKNGKPGSKNARKCDFCLKVFKPKEDNEYVTNHVEKCRLFSEFAIDGKKCSFCNYFFRPYDKLLRHIENQHFTENNETISGSSTSTQEFKEEKQNNKTIGQGVVRIIMCKYCNISFIADAHQKHQEKCQELHPYVIHTSISSSIGKNHALKKYDQFVQNTSCFSQEHIFCNFNNGKKSIFAPKKKSENCIFGSFKLFSCAKNEFLPVLKLQKMNFCTFEIALFFNFRACTVYLVLRLC